MEIGIPQSILYPSAIHSDFSDGTGCSEIVFNSFNDDPQSLAFPNGSINLLPAMVNAGILVQQNIEDPAIRTAIDNKAHKSGGIMHDFYRGPRYITLEALMLGDTPSARETVSEYMRGAMNAIMQRDGLYLYKPSNAPTRFLTVRHYEAVKIAHSTSTTGTAVGVAAPKSAIVTLVAADWTSYTYPLIPYSLEGGDDLSDDQTGTATIPNNGNADMWPKVRVYGVGSFTLKNLTTNEQVVFVPGGGFGTPDPAAFYEIDMLNERIIYDSTASGGNRYDATTGLVPTSSNFWRIPPGGAIVSGPNSSGPIRGGLFASTVVYANDAWA